MLIVPFKYDNQNDQDCCKYCGTKHITLILKITEQNIQAKIKHSNTTFIKLNEHFFDLPVLSNG